MFFNVMFSARTALATALPVLFSFIILIPLLAIVDLISSRPPKLHAGLSAQISAMFAVGTFVVTFVSTLFDLRKMGRIDESREPSFSARPL
jgi:hypothetical protein